MKIYCGKTVVHFDSNTSYDSPKIIASNHPNSFFDAIVIAVNYPKPIYFLARGDAFKNPLAAKFLNAIHLIPIYRLSEGKSNLSKNEATFERCISLFKQNKTILIFSEGLCVNEWQLRPIKKGTARLALMALKDNIHDLKIQPANINYSSFTKNPKDILLHFNKEFFIESDSDLKESVFYNSFNSQLRNGILEKMILQSTKVTVQLFELRKSGLKKIGLSVPALIGYALNHWFYTIFKNITRKKTKNTVFYDSVLFGLLLICYPVMVTIVAIIAGLLLNFKIGLFLFISFPLTAYCYSAYKAN
ncbi:1-acyl-sn-glycerol-3-phosphate acyltransferase [Flavobacterium algicola]|uniref:1-acyl-sn-glycerol-3-phosphate acyltransferase n=1 Tax=Flavobacterium algicola TaxID=556529 RepID=UPI001EFD7B9F|nr:1-acyl-sn-glycerol-3-phosphate acyltransferase [Flavobacterium algicola]MCG9793862.1 1-acyl-sn-glycerol-3-phosphate acyltransferase [Flavobacterium algicola]